ncbi:hypothetical protein AAEO56_16855 [Flavobacterium sp. DGU11]|uniref:HTH luxR-type domain-containing protein n=1 Tax=Flavobacterium arundinis TaxID=3139143 RepID=A0ABU9I0I7_9FLAO
MATCKQVFFFLLVTLITCGASCKLYASESWSAVAFDKMSNDERYRYVHSYPFWKIDDSTTLTLILRQMYETAEKKKDIHTVLAVEFYWCLCSGNPGIKLPDGKTAYMLLKDIKALAEQNGYDIEAAVADFYLDRNTDLKLTNEQKYIEAQKITERMQAIGFEKFRDYYIDNMMLNIAMYMWDMEDFEKAFRYLSIAERFINKTEEGAYTYTQVLSYLQSYWKMKKDYSKSLSYAYKIKNFHEHFTTTDPMRQWWNNFWKSFSNIEIADILIKEGKFAESEQYAGKGYELSQVPERLVNKIVSHQAELDALLVLTDVKLQLGKLKDAGILLERALQIKNMLEAKGKLEYFKPLKLYKLLAAYNERMGNANDALTYMHKAAALQDSLNKKNDAHKLALAQQRFDAEKYSQKIAMVERERQLEKMLRNAAVAILALVVIMGFAYFRNLKARKKRKEAELEATRLLLLQQTKHLREKSELADSLRSEIEKHLSQTEKSQYLLQLSNATILTDEDWTNFRTLFEKVYPDFIIEQKQLYPGITPAEIRLIVLEKLGLTAQEMANMLGVNKNTIHQTRLRLRKKMDNVTA